ncbi:T9SS type A sorting domain-containing protein [Flavobacterium hercynium]|uniref:Ig-like domain-containing protein n=1 Tax=Flavobacterium hercynium TaxID=387094 RepID=A0A226HAD5_9FLAO|nr:T9SS type A sorting domain-containing protein [Flavobacterium hercynium]OXA90390.1 hypothetical protein B0A66_12525 [Flavobacterium hercynium]SMP26026.1 Por secretion system C-terminal sorting domain-containing protein [Flavobacterium hercynium]
MKKNYLLLLLLVFSMQYLTAQITTETFEAGTAGTPNFTSGTATFNLTNTYSGGFTLVNIPNTGYASSNKYIQVADDANQESMGQSGFITITSGTFRVSSLWIYLSGNSGQDAGVTFLGQPGSVTFIGRLGGVEQFSVIKNTTGADNGYAAPGNGFTQANFATLEGVDNTNVMIDQLEIKLSANYDYFAIDNFAFEAQASAPTVTTTTATAANIGAVRASLGGNVTAGGPLTAKGIVWSTTATTPTLANNVVTNVSTATGTYSDFATGLTPSTLIYYRAYATNNVGTSYGAVLSFTTNAALAATQSQTDVTCNMGSNGTGTVVPSGGKTPYTYSWSPAGGTAATASGLGAGQYNVTITDGDLTTLVKTFDITQPPAATISFTTNPPSRTICLGSNTTFPATAVNATAYQWEVNTGSGFSTITNGGVYSNATTSSLTITGATAGMNGYTYRLRASSVCTPGGVTSNASTLSVSNMTVTTLTKANVQCFGDNNGSASLTTSGGIAPYTYSWSPSGGTASSASGLAPGTYTITVTDNIGCTKTHQVVINGPTVAFTATSSTTAVSCFGGNNGTATITAAGGTAPYTYTWSTGAVTQTITGRQGGTYSVTVTDDNGCDLLVENIVIGQPAAMLGGTPSSTSVSCFGGNNGTATIAPTGGTPGYTYAWSNGATTATASNLQAGTYSVTITDANSCDRTISGIVVGGPAAALGGTPSITTVSCYGGSNGTATITPTGGTSGYTYEWSNGATSQTITGLQAGVYSVTITDANSCTRTINNILVSQPSEINSNATQTNVSCFNGSNGTATVAPTGGAGSYTYLWAPSGSTNASVSGLTAGTYSVKITDNNGCEKDQSFTISQPAAIVLTQGTINNVSCFNGSNGSATVSATGGAGSFTYSWSPTGGTAATASGLTAGTYTVTVTDANACQATENFTISQPAAALTVLSSTQDNITCGGTPTGSASVVVTGGTGSYTYSWSPSGGTAASATGLYSGTYTVTITDVNGCQTSENFTITEPANPLTASQGAIVNIACYGDTTGSATVSVVGGDGNYTYSWAPSGGTAATATGLAAGTYTVTVTDGASCQATQTFTINQPLAALSATTASTGVSCFGGSNGSASVTVSNGTSPYTYAWSPLGGNVSSISGRPAGDYTCTITDANGCTLVKTITISSPVQFSATVSKTDVSCNGGSNGTATITPSGATAPFTYTWNPTGGSNATASGLSAGTYVVVVQDANTCQYSVSVTIDQPDALTATASQINVSCPGGNNGEASVIATGGTAPYNYIWSPAGGTAATATGLTAGNYSVMITDSNGCFTTRSFTLINTPDNSAPVPDLLNLPDITGYCSIFSSEITVPTATDNCAGTINATTTDPLNYTATGNYSITWTYDDGNGNITTQTQNVIVLDSPLDALTFTDKTVTYNGNVQTIELGNLPSDAIVTYSITPATTTPNGALDAGNYTVTALVFPGVSAPNCVPVILSAQLTIEKAAQQITFAPLEDRILGVNNTFTLNATSNSGLPVTYSYIYTTALPSATVSSNGDVELLRTGEVTITASQLGDDNYLPAVSVSQVLVIKNNDIMVSSITIGSTVYANPPKEIRYVMECDENTVNVAILNQTNATITPAPTYTVTPPKPGIYTENAVVTSQDGSVSTNYTITIEKPFGFYDIVQQKFNNVLLVNNNPATNGGYTFVSYEWFKNGVSVGTGQYYSAGENITDELDTNANFMVKMKTKEGQILSTCDTTIELDKSIQAKLYPNPIQTGKVVTVEADFPKEELEKMQISLYSVSGKLIKTVQSSTVKTNIQLPQTTESNMYLVVIETANIKKSLKVIVNK